MDIWTYICQIVRKMTFLKIISVDTTYNTAYKKRGETNSNDFHDVNLIKHPAWKLTIMLKSSLYNVFSAFFSHLSGTQTGLVTA